MATDVQRLRSGELCRLLNSTPLGECLGERQFQRHRTRAGLRIAAEGDPQRINLLRYLAWLFDQRHAPPESDARSETSGGGGEGYDAHRERSRLRNQLMSASGREIGDLPAVQDAGRRDGCARNFRGFCERYLPQTFHLKWSPDHLKVIAKIETAVLEGGLFAMAMPRGSGKALALDTPLPTPTGWTTMGDVRVGDQLFDERGRQCRVTFATAVMHARPCFRVSFSDGESIVCDADHLWSVEDRWSRRNPLTLRTADMAARVRIGSRGDRIEHRYAIPMTEPIETIGSNLPIDPYALGVWLGNGTATAATLTNHVDDHEEFALHLERCGERLERRESGDRGRACCAVLGRGRSAGRAAGPLQMRLRALGVLGSKHIPGVYLRACASDRWALLQGLMDTDGSISGQGRCEITLKADRLADGVAELLASLGIKFGVHEKWVRLNGCLHGPYARFGFTAFEDRPVFRLERKRSRLTRHRIGSAATRRFIAAIDAVDSVPVRCVQVDSTSSLYLAGRRMVPTHNTSLCETACLWALLYGHREFVALIGSDEEHAANMLDSIKAELENSDLLLSDFPEVCFPIRKLEGIHQRASGQLFRGKQTHIGWTAKEIVLPTIEGSSAAGGIIRVAGITGRVRGMKYKRPDGNAVRPSLVLVDDPQTDESARSPSQCMSRERVLAGAILGLAGPGTKIAGLMTLTVVRPDDLADRLLDRDKHPQWQGERTKMVYEFPKSEGLWAKYAQLRGDCLRAERGTKEATEFYAANREKMDAGAKVGWEERFNPDELSAIQHAMNLRIDDAIAFQAEYQNDPIPEDLGGRSELTVEDICARTNGHPPEVVPHGCTKLTAFIDVQQKALFWLVAAWEENFTGSVVAYGTEPDQKSEWFTLKDIRRTLAMAKPGAGFEGTIYAGLERLTASLLGREWRVDSGGTVRIDRCLIDANWGQSTEVVYQFCRQSPHASLVIPSHGRYVGAAGRPFAEYKQGRGERVGLNWRIPPMTGRRAVKHVVFDSNWWKSFIVARLSAPVGDPGCLMLHGKDPRKHRLLAEHLTAEYRVQTQGRGRTVDEWKLRLGSPDNHWLDCLVGAAVAASIEGATLPGMAAAKLRTKRVSFAEMQQRARARRALESWS